MYRSHTCGELRKSEVGLEVRIAGWIHSVRDHGGVIFIDLRDHYGNCTDSFGRCICRMLPGCLLHSGE